MKRKQYTRGLRVGVPISLGYLAVAFTMGITARNAGLSAVQATLTSFLVNASAGQYAAFTLMAAQGGYLENGHLRAGDQRPLPAHVLLLEPEALPKTKLWQRLTVGFAVTDEMFGMAIAEPEEVSPWYYFGMMSIAIPGWSLGTFWGRRWGISCRPTWSAP
ncbi:MAG: AzlC family ABC transporter permease [Evtepia sp.]